jgi:Tfp pilus assembly protein PilV
MTVLTRVPFGRAAPRKASTRRSILGSSRHQRRGLSLVEIVVALTILTGAMMGLAQFGVHFTQTLTSTRQRSTALDLAADRLEDVKVSSTYASIDSYAGTEVSPNGAKNFTRKTIVTRVGGASSSIVDYKIVTVEVTGAAIALPVRKTTIIANF